MRTREDYLDQAAKFHALAAATSQQTLKALYADLAECYRQLAAERQRLIEQGALSPED